MKVLLISANVEEINMTVLPFGLACVAAATSRAGHAVRLLDLLGESDPVRAIGQAIRDVQPEAIGISVRNIDDQRMAAPRFLLEPVKAMVAVCKDLSSAPVILGGAGYSIFPDSVRAYLGADLGIQGEGEIAFPVLLEALSQGADIAGLVDRPGSALHRRSVARCRDLDRLPLPGPEIWPTAVTGGNGVCLPVQTRRGCPMACGYCSTSRIEGRLTRRRTPALVAAWLQEWQEAGVRRFFFVDNTFNLPLAYAKELCRAIIARGLAISWQCIVYPRPMDRELAALLAKAGCTQVSLGFESGSPLILRQMHKRYSREEARRTAAMLGENGINRMGFLLLGYPGETRESVLASLEFADSLQLESMRVTRGVRIYPGTDLARRARAEGVIGATDDLLRPAYYLAPDLGDWLDETVAAWAGSRPHWLV